MAARITASSVSAPHSSEAPAAAVWLLLGSKKGDNSQIVALADALGLPYRAIQLRFNLLHWLLPAMLGRSLASVVNRTELTNGPLPELVISSGLRSVPAARWLQGQARAPCKLVHIGRPWGPMAWFDLIVTTPQYALPPAANVQHNLLPLLADTPTPAESTQDLPAHLGKLPRPWTVALLGGHSRPLRFTVDTAKALGQQLSHATKDQGSVIVLGSPRTPCHCVKAIQSSLTVPNAVLPYDASCTSYRLLRQTADAFVVTGDSVLMTAELLVCGKPLKVFPLPEVPDVLVRLARGWRDAAARRPWLRPAFEWARNHGLLPSLRDIALFHRQLDSAGVFKHPELAQQLRDQEKVATVQRIRQLLNPADVPVAKPEADFSVVAHALR